MNILRPHVDKLGAYAVDQDLSLVKLNQNESPEDVPERVKEDVFERLRRAGWNRYPEGGPAALEEKLSVYTGFPIGGILAGNGSNELIQATLAATCEPGDRIVTVRPGFAVYKRVAGILSIGIDEVPLEEGFAYDAEAILERARGARALVLASPNNPTGTSLTPEAAARIVREFAGLVVIDEAYYEFLGRSVQGLVAGRENLVILRTASKALRLAGIRLGYLLGDEAVVAGIAKAKLPFSVGLFARIAAETILDHRAEVDEAVRRIVAERDRVFLELNRIPGISPVPSSANFILFGTGDMTARALFEKLRSRGVLLRPFDDPSLAKHLRATIGTRGENDAFLGALKDVVAEGAR
jgi:histidinol-phosphate aminotransferase